MAWEWLEKYLKGTPGKVLQGGVEGTSLHPSYPWQYVEHEAWEPSEVLPTRGLFGTGGQYGAGGLLTTQPENPGGGMLNLFSNLPVVTGLEILQGGMTGKPIEQTLLPAFKKGLTTTTAVESVKAAKRKRDYINKYKDQVPPGDMELFLAFPEKYISAKLQKDMRKDTLQDRAVAIFDKISALPADEQKIALAKLKETDPAAADLYKKMIKGGVTMNDIMAMMLTGNLSVNQTNQTDQTQTIPGTGYEKGQKIKLATGEEGIVVEVDDEGRILKVKPIKK